jgi:hypothetical protein
MNYSRVARHAERLPAIPATSTCNQPCYTTDDAKGMPMARLFPDLMDDQIDKAPIPGASLADLDLSKVAEHITRALDSGRGQGTPDEPESFLARYRCVVPVDGALIPTVGDGGRCMLRSRLPLPGTACGHRQSQFASARGSDRPAGAGPG